MPIRVYDLAKKLGIESAQVILKAKELGIHAPVPTSSVDRITAEFLEQQLTQPSHQAKSPSQPHLPSALPPSPSISVAPQEPAPNLAMPIRDTDVIRLERTTLTHIYRLEQTSFKHLKSFTFQPGLPQTNVPSAAKESCDELLLITNAEDAKLECKPSARWDLYQNKENAALQRSICKTAAAFFNSGGGTLLIGVADNGRVLGINQDYATLQKPTRDDFLLFLHSLLLDRLGHDLSPYITVNIERLGPLDVCIVTISGSPRPVYLNESQGEAFYVRAGNSSKSLSTSVVVDYCKSHWPPAPGASPPVWL